MLAVEVFFASIISGMATVYVAVKKSDEIVVVRSGSDITQDDWYCRQHEQWNWAGDECNCCAMDGERYDYTEFYNGKTYVIIQGR